MHTEELFKGLGRVRDIKTGPDGLIYVALEAIGKPGRIVRLVPTPENNSSGPGLTIRAD
jgi:glucose/arabinose dehydrogenase